jgi:hypothetical protein
LNWQDGAAFATGVGAGVLAAVSSIVTAPLAVAAALADPAAAVQGIQAQADTVARGAAFLVHDPSGAAVALNDDPRAVGTVLGQALGTAALAAAPRALAGARGGGDTLYRAVSEAEFQDLRSIGGFRPHPGNLSATGKYFAEQPGHAAKWGELLFADGRYRVVAGQVSSKVPHMRWETLDGIGPARFYEGSECSQIRYRGEVK